MGVIQGSTSCKCFVSARRMITMRCSNVGQAFLDAAVPSASFARDASAGSVGSRGRRPLLLRALPERRVEPVAALLGRDFPGDRRRPRGGVGSRPGAGGGGLVFLGLGFLS